MIDFHLDFTYENSDKKVLNNVAGKVEKGRCVVFCGKSGCGKTTLIRCINHLIPEFYEGELKGFCNIKGENIEDFSVGKVGKIASSVFQDPRSHFFTINSSTEVAFALENFGLSQEKIAERVDKAFSIFGLEKLQNRNVYELSSGERQLVSILSAWAADTDILILDEPTANLDYAAIKDLSKLLLALKNQGKTIVLSEHRLHYLGDICDEYWLVENGEISKKFSKEEIMGFSQEQLSELSLRATDLSSVKKEVKSFSSGDVKNTITAKNISFGYKKNRAGKKTSARGILQDINFSASTGDVVGLIGSNGCGKTTFGKILAGLIKNNGGNISFNNNVLNYKELQKNVLFIMQETEFQFFTNTVMNELKYGLVNVEKDKLNEKIEYLLKKCGMWELRNRHPFSLSGGQMQRLALIIACLSSKPVVVLDEPTAGLDKTSLENCISLIEEMKKTKIVIIITHDIELIGKACNSCQCISQGKIVKSFNLEENGCQISEIVDYMDKNFRLHDSDKKIDVNKEMKKCVFDPRIKLLIMIISMIIMTSTNIKLVFSFQILVLIVAIIEGFYISSFVGIVALCILWAGASFCSYGIMSFFANFLPRMILPWFSLETLIGKGEGTRTLAAFRKIHMPEKIIMIFSVIFRFFPVLSNDIKLMNQSIKTRGVFQKFSEKIKSFPSYLEVMIVPLALRVIKIAETLSASAETRGMGLKGKRQSYVLLKWSWKDWFLAALTIGAVIFGIL